jgi:hypothetical protein
MKRTWILAIVIGSLILGSFACDMIKEKVEEQTGVDVDEAARKAKEVAQRVDVDELKQKAGQVADAAVAASKLLPYREALTTYAPMQIRAGRIVADHASPAIYPPSAEDITPAQWRKFVKAVILIEKAANQGTAGDAWRAKLDSIYSTVGLANQGEFIWIGAKEAASASSLSLETINEESIGTAVEKAKVIKEELNR